MYFLVPEIHILIYEEKYIYDIFLKLTMVVIYIKNIYNDHSKQKLSNALGRKF